MFEIILNWFKTAKKVYIWNWVEDRWGYCEAYNPKHALQIAIGKQGENKTVDRNSIRESNYEEIAYIRKAYSVWYTGEVVS
jgi:hypothetical protein